MGNDVASRLLRQIRFDQVAEMEEQRRQVMAALAEALGGWYWETDPEMRYTFVSGEWERRNGLPASVVLGTNRPAMAERYASASMDWARHLCELRLGRASSVNVVADLPGNARQVLRVAVVPRFDANNEVVGYCGITVAATKPPT